MIGRPQHIDRDQVLDAAEAIVLTGGVLGLTIDAVAQAVGITKGGVQYCFGTKSGLIDAMVERWCREFKEQIDHLAGPSSDPVERIGSYVEATAKIDRLSHARAAGLLAILLQSPDHMAGVREWYRSLLDPLDTDSEGGRRARLAFMAMEGAFLLRSFGFMQMESESQWEDIYDEIRSMLPATRAKTRENPTKAATRQAPAKAVARKAAAKVATRKPLPDQRNTAGKARGGTKKAEAKTKTKKKHPR